MQREDHALLGPKAKLSKRIGGTIDACGQLCVRVAAAIVDVGKLAASPRLEIALEKIAGGVVRTRDIDARGADAVISRAQRGHGFLLLFVPDPPFRSW